MAFSVSASGATGCNRRFVRNQVIFASTLFQNVCYHPSECQIIATGTDKKVLVVVLIQILSDQSCQHNVKTMCANTAPTGYKPLR